ncbi:tetratricopeptide repeat protein [Bacteroides propionicifaciens]|uniref:tetratricopeptide repeat protein n=1 Tax=Bacteroides propionicifaciens TaxID=392838 RepID=UPI0003767873|nr:tetratricopeptide repeat protein [Bacteroides propionicifaciens]
MKKKLIRGLCVLMASAPLVLNAQTSTAINSPQRLFTEGKALFQDQSFAAAIPSLRAFIGTKPEASLVEQAEYMLVVAAYNLKDINRVELLEEYMETYPDSPNTNYINGLLGSAYYFDEEFEYALAYFNSVNLDYLPTADRNDIIYRMATSFLKVGKLDESIAWFETLRQTSTSYNKDSQYYIGYIRYTQGKYDAALKNLLPLQTDQKYGELVPYYIASSYFIMGHYDKAQNVAEGYLTQYPRNKYSAEMYRILAESNYQFAQYNRAIQAFEKYLASGSKLGRGSAYMLGMSYYNTGVYSKAVTYLGQAISDKDDTLTQNAYLNLGLSYLQLADKTNARMAFEQASRSNADLAVKEQALYNYALSIHETSFSAFGESVNVFERFLNEFPSSKYADKVSDYLVDLYMTTRSYESALNSIARIDRPSPRILEAKQKLLFQMGVQNFANSDFNQAIDYFSSSLALGQYNAQTRADAAYWRGESYYRLGDFNQAARNFKDYLSLTPIREGETYALAHYNLGYIAFNKKSFDEAENWFSKYTQLETGDNRIALADAFNRRGDAYLQNRAFIQAKGNYTRALNTSAQVGDYSIYQLALVAGLQRNYAEKVALLSRLSSEHGDSPYVAQGLYEKGRGYIQQQQNNEAIRTFQDLIAKFPENAVTRKAATEIGLLYYQDGNYDQAIKTYKWVVDKYPGSDEARLAMRDLKSLYVDQNRVDEYAALAESITGGIKMEVTEQDSLTYIAAEKVYLRGRDQEASQSFERYLERYPAGAFSLNSHYYLSVIAKKQGDIEGMVNHSTKLLSYPDNPYYEEALIMRSELAYENKQYAEALDFYKRLKDKASTPERISMAQVGRMRSAKNLNNNNEIILASSDLLLMSKLTPELQNEALYNRAKAYIADNNKDAAMKDLVVLAGDTRTAYGAEAKYLIAENLYNNKKYPAAEKEVLQFIEQSTPHAYWLARSFVLLSDVYAATGKNLEAKQYLLSLQQNYKGDDDIQLMIDTRLENLKSINE